MKWVNPLKALAKSLRVSLDTISEEDLKALKARLERARTGKEVADITRQAIIEQSRSGGSVANASEISDQSVQLSGRLTSYLSKGKVKITDFVVPEIGVDTRKIINREVNVKEFKSPEFKG